MSSKLFETPKKIRQASHKIDKITSKVFEILKKLLKTNIAENDVKIDENLI